MQVFEYDRPDRFVAGTVGEPGHRTFYLQASGRGRMTSVALEKQQVAALAERVDELLDEVQRRSSGSAVPAAAPTDAEDRAPLDTPVEEEFRVGLLAIAWDEEAALVLLEARALSAEDEEALDPAAAGLPTDEAGVDANDEEEEPDSDVLRVRLTPLQARAFAKRATQVVGAGRPPCPFCGLPLDPSGHVCPRQNGYRRR